MAKIIRSCTNFWRGLAGLLFLLLACVGCEKKTLPPGLMLPDKSPPTTQPKKSRPTIQPDRQKPVEKPTAGSLEVPTSQPEQKIPPRLEGTPVPPTQ